MSAPLVRLLAKPQRFTFDAAVRILSFARRTPDPTEAARFESPPGLGFPSAEVSSVTPGGAAADGSPRGGSTPQDAQPSRGTTSDGFGSGAGAIPRPGGGMTGAAASTGALEPPTVAPQAAGVATIEASASTDMLLAAVIENSGEAAAGRTAWSFSTSGSDTPAAEVTDSKREPPGVSVTLIGLTGPSGVLPRQYSDAVVATLRGRSRALHGFLALISHRLVAAFASAGIKYRLHRAADAGVLTRDDQRAPRRTVDDALLALTGFGTPHLADRVAPGADTLRHYAGLFASHPRSADRLEALASDWLGRPVTVEQFVGAWLPLPVDQRTRLASGPHSGTFAVLGTEAVIGVRAWDQQARIVLRIGPLDRATFDALLPDRPLLRSLVGLVRAFVGYEVGFAINPVLARDAMQPLRLRAEAPSGSAAVAEARLGWNSWIPAPEPPRTRADAADAVFEAERVEEVAS